MIETFVTYLINNAPLTGGVTIILLLALYCLHNTYRSIVLNRTNFLIVPTVRSCFSCDSHFVVQPQDMPADSARDIETKSNVLRCREMLRDEVRLPEKEFQADWEWAFDQPAGDYTAVAGKCPKFMLIQGGKK